VRLLKAEILPQEHFMTADVKFLKIPFAEIEEITKQKTGFSSWVFPGSFDQKSRSIFLCECLWLYEFISAAFRVLRKSACSDFCIKKFGSAFYLFKSATRL
jgi:hypothetical protein